MASRSAALITTLLSLSLGACLSSGPLKPELVGDVSLVVNSTVSVSLSGRETDALDVEANHSTALEITWDLERLLGSRGVRVVEAFTTVGIPGEERYLLPWGWERGRRASGLALREGTLVADGLEDDQLRTLRDASREAEDTAPFHSRHAELRDLELGGDLLVIVQVDGRTLNAEDRRQNQARVTANGLIFLMGVVAAACGTTINDPGHFSLEKDGLEVRVQCYDLATGKALRVERFEARRADLTDAVGRRCRRIVGEWFRARRPAGGENLPSGP